MMDKNELLRPLHEVVARVQELIDLAHAEKWEELDAAAQKYQQHVLFLDDNTYLQAINDAYLVEDAKTIILQIQNMNDELDVYTNIQREKIASELRQINQSGKALDAYGR